MERVSLATKPRSLLMAFSSARILDFTPARHTLMHAVRALQPEFPSWRLTVYANHDGKELLTVVHAPTDTMLIARWTGSGWSVSTQYGDTVCVAVSLIRALRVAMR